MRSVGTCSGASPPTYEEVSKFLLDAAMPCQFATNHAVMLVPRSGSFSTGEADMSAKAYTRLPKRVVDMNADGYTGYEVAFDKVVLVGMDPAAAKPGIFIGDCGESAAVGRTDGRLLAEFRGMEKTFYMFVKVSADFFWHFTFE